MGNNVRALIVYPTRALANDQLRRITQILYRINAALPTTEHLTIGILTGDTPRLSENFQMADSPLQNCPHCQSPLTDFGIESLPPNHVPLTVARCRCGAQVSFFRFSRQDILAAPPDILVTSPDMINRMLQSPKWRPYIFTPQLQALVWDEAHVYGGAFGCHVAHTLRRVEEALGRRPLYTALSATIANARAMAALLFNVAPHEIQLLRAKGQEEEESSEDRPYLDFTAGPVRFRHHWAVAPAPNKNRYKSVVTSTVKTVDALGHAIRDPHFRKTLIFSNSRQNTDKLVRLLKDHEERYFVPLINRILPSIKNGVPSSPLTEAELEIVSSIGRWCQHFIENGTLYSAPLEFGWHRAGLEVSQRLRVVNRFMATQPLSTQVGESPWPVDTMVATSTLELGIDIGDVTTVINCGAPRSVNEYVQRVGRAGRQKDSLALTIIDPTNPLDFNFLSHFEKFAHPMKQHFEEVPLVISNPEITRRHLWARLLDFLAQEVGSPHGRDLELTVADLKHIIVEGKFNLQEYPEDFAEATFNALFSDAEIKRWNHWRALERECIPGSSVSSLSSAELLGWWKEKLVLLAKRFARGDVSDETLLTGATPFDSDLIPSLRDIGTQVNVRVDPGAPKHGLTASRHDEILDVISRRTCVEMYPPGAQVAVGTGSYSVGPASEDEEATLWLRRQFRSSDGDKAVRYFHKFFDSPVIPFPQSARELLSSLDITLTVPSEIRVVAAPDRYHCSRCGSTYNCLPTEKGKPTPICGECKNQLRQLTEVYACGRCGRQKMPPIPKVCPNPACVESATSRRNGARFMDEQYKQVGRLGKDAHIHNDFFRFDALPFLHWQCRNCKTIFNYHATYGLPLTIQRQVMGCSLTSSSHPSPQEIAKRFLLFPESWWSRDKEANGFVHSWFECKDCRAEGAYRKIHVVNPPTSQAILHEYWLQGPSLAPPREIFGVHISSHHVKRLALANERASRYWSHAKRQWQMVIEPIYETPSSLLADGSENHALYLTFGNALQSIARNSQIPLCCHSGQQCQCEVTALSAAIPNSSASSENVDNDSSFRVANFETDIGTRPMARLTHWETGRSPDPRRHWCHIVGAPPPSLSKESNIVCGSSNCLACHHFQSGQMRSYLALHTLKHALLIAAPRFCGASRGQLRGILNPNDENEFDLMIVDTTEGGSGVLTLLYRNWESVWDLAGEVLNSALLDPGLLLLPQGCSRFNCDLCPSLGRELWKEIGNY